MKLAIDGMGGDQAPGVIIEGMAQALQRSPEISFILYGNEKTIAPVLDKYPALCNATRMHHTDEVVTADMKPSEALRGLKASSMRLALQAVKEGNATGALSAGNTGAYMALSKIILGTIPGITRPAIISQIPTRTGESVFLDLGGNLVCNSRHLVEFAVMGRLFAQHILFKKNPTIGLLNVGSEASKGMQHLKDAFVALKKIFQDDFVGFVEGDDLFHGQVDVIVADGFSGNVALKASEGSFKFFAEALKRSFRVSLRARLGYLLAAPAFHALRLQLDPRKYNGACWLGLKGIAVKSHGGTDAFGFRHAIAVAKDMVQANMSQLIAQGVAALEDKLPENI